MVQVFSFPRVGPDATLHKLATKVSGPKASTCPHHPLVKLVCFCPACRGSVTSKAKSMAARRNGKRGGRPRKKKAGRR